MLPLNAASCQEQKEIMPLNTSLRLQIINARHYTDSILNALRDLAHGWAGVSLEDLTRAIADNGDADGVQDVGSEWPVGPGVSGVRILQQLFPHPRQALDRALMHRHEARALNEGAHHDLQYQGAT
jgi:hypothetical protein